MQVYDIAVVGAGPAGIMAAIRCGELKKRAVLIERNNSIGKKILLSGKGRCNITNIIALDEFIAKFGKQGAFLRSAFFKFYNQDLIDLFKAKGLDLKIERQGRVFPVTDKAASIIEVLSAYLAQNKVKILYNERLKDIKKEDNFFRLFLEGGQQIVSKKVVLATGGKSFSFTGSSGDGYNISRRLSHTIVPLVPGLVPLKAKEGWVKDLKGLTLKNVRLTFKGLPRHPNTRCAGKIISDIGEVLFTHFGISGPLVLDLSSSVLDLLREHREVLLDIDLKPGLTFKQLENRLLREFKASGSKNLRNILKNILPLRLVDVFISLLKAEPDKKGNQVSKEEKRAIVHLLKSFSLNITGSLPIEEAMVTCGGVSRSEINPRTMESKIIPGLYFAGEIIDASASSGGYNLQAAFSTGYLSGEQAALSL